MAKGQTRARQKSNGLVHLKASKSDKYPSKILKTQYILATFALNSKVIFHLHKFHFEAAKLQDFPALGYAA